MVHPANASEPGRPFGAAPCPSVVGCWVFRHAGRDDRHEPRPWKPGSPNGATRSLAIASSASARSRREAPDRPLVLFLGTSRAQNAFDPSAMGTLNEPGSPLYFNFGQSGSSPLKVLLTLSRLLDAGIRPAAIVVEVLPLWLGAESPPEEQFRAEALRLSASDFGRLGPYSNHIDDLRKHWLLARVAPWHAQRAVLMSHWLPRWLPWDERIDPQWEGMEPDGFVPFPEEFGNGGYRRLATAHARQEYAGTFAGIRMTDHAWNVLGDVVARCRSEGIAVARSSRRSLRCFAAGIPPVSGPAAMNASASACTGWAWNSSPRSMGSASRTSSMVITCSNRPPRVIAAGWPIHT